MIYADIIVDISHEKLDRSFQYRVPKELEAEIQLGMVVTIPFGNGNHERKGYVTGLSDKPAFDISKMKELHGICSSEETTEERLIALAAWMKNRYGSTMVQALKTVLPVREKVKAKEKRYIVLNMDVAAAEQLEAAIRDDTVLISIMMANNVVGTILDIQSLEAVARKHRILFHTDAVQAVGHIPIEVHKLGVDFLSVSAHKFNGPKGVGVLYCRIPTRLPAYLTGGGQEKEGRSGTENVPGIVGMTRALEEQTERMQSNMEYLYALSKRMDEKVLNIPGVLKTGDPEKRLPGLCSYVVEGIAHSVLLVNEMNTYGICISSGSACSAASQEASHVLLSLGIEKQLAENSIRISLGMDNTEEDVDYAASMLEAAINKIRTEQASRAPRLEGRVADMAGGKEA